MALPEMYAVEMFVNHSSHGTMAARARIQWFVAEEVRMFLYWDPAVGWNDLWCLRVRCMTDVAIVGLLWWSPCRILSRCNDLWCLRVRCMTDVAMVCLLWWSPCRILHSSFLLLPISPSAATSIRHDRCIRGS